MDWLSALRLRSALRPTALCAHDAGGNAVVAGSIPSLRETGFFVGGFNWFADWVAMPLGMAALKVAPKQAAGAPAG